MCITLAKTGESFMVDKSKLKIQSWGIFLSAVFYLIVGILTMVALFIYNLQLIHFAIIGALSLITAFGLFGAKKWTVWFATGLFFIGNVFSAFNLHYSVFRNDIMLQIAFAMHLFLLWITTIYILARRKNLT